MGGVAGTAPMSVASYSRRRAAPRREPVYSPLPIFSVAKN